jgi:hypothetical protein
MPATTDTHVVEPDPLQLLHVNARVVALANELNTVCKKTLKIVEVIETRALIQEITLDVDALGNEVAQAYGLPLRVRHETASRLQSAKTLIELLVTDHAEDLWNARRSLIDEFLAILEEFDGHLDGTERGITYDTVCTCLRYVVAVDDTWIRCMNEYGEEYGVTIEDKGPSEIEEEADGEEWMEDSASE